MENVANLFGKKFIAFYEEWEKFLTTLGYQTKKDILLASNFNLPQNRERAFAVSILNNNLSLGCQSIEDFSFEKGEKTNLTIKDFLDKENVSEDLFLFDKNGRFKRNQLSLLMNAATDDFSYVNLKTYPTASTVSIKTVKYNKDTFEVLEEFDKNDSLSIDNVKETVYHGDAVVMKEPESKKTKRSGIHSSVLLNYTNFSSENYVYFDDGYIATLTANGAQSRLKVIDSQHGNRVRYLTAKEHLLLMGFGEEDYQALSSFSTVNPVLIKRQAGNSIAVSVLESIFKKMFII